MAPFPRPPKRNHSQNKKGTQEDTLAFQPVPEEEEDEPVVTFGLAHRAVMAKSRPSQMTVTVEPRPVSNFALQ